MNELTVVGRGGVKHPDILTEDEAQNLLDKYGVGGKAVKIPNGTDLQKFLGRCVGGFYYDDASVSGSIGGPIKDKVYYTVISAGVPGNRAVLASSHGNNLWIAEIYGDVFRGWVTFSRPADVTNEIKLAIQAHEATVDHPYATESQQGFIEIASQTEGVSKTENSRAMTSLRTQQLLDTYGIGQRSIQIPPNTDLAVYFATAGCGFYHLDASTGFGYANGPGDEAYGWGEIICTAHEISNFRSLICLIPDGRIYVAGITSGVFSGWKRKLELKDIPHADFYTAGLTRVLDTVDSYETTNAASANSVRVVYNIAEGKVPLTRRINGLTLNNDINITPGLIGAYTGAQTDYLISTRVPTSRLVNGLSLATDINITPNLIGAYTMAQSDAITQTRVPLTRRINGYTLDNDINITPGLIGTYDANQINALINDRVPVGRRINGYYLNNDLWLTPGIIGTYTAAEIDAKLAGLGSIQDIRWSPEYTIGAGAFTGWNKGRITTVPAGGVLTNLADYAVGKLFIEDIDQVWWRYLQKQVNGAWYNVGI